MGGGESGYEYCFVFLFFFFPFCIYGRLYLFFSFFYFCYCFLVCVEAFLPPLYACLWIIRERERELNDSFVNTKTGSSIRI